MTLPTYVQKAIALLNAAGHEAYAVGGAVRDLLRGESPDDFDLTTSASPDEMKAVFHGFRTIETGIAHGTLTVLLDGTPLEITTYRVDGGYSDARHPDGVTFTKSLKEDAARRDFTVNAMAYHPKEGLMDFFGGREDLKNRILRTVGEGERRFEEDALRILRGLRFSSALGFALQEDTVFAMRQKKEGLKKISGERIRTELCKLLCGNHAAEVLLAYPDILGVFLPELLPTVGLDQKNPHHAFSLYEHTVRAVASAPRDPVIRLSLLLHDLGKPSCFTVDEKGIGHFYGHAEKSAEMAKAILSRLRFDNETAERILLLVKYHDLVPDPKGKQFRRLRTKYGDRFLTDWLTVIRADRTGQAPVLSPEKSAALAEAEGALDTLLKEEERMTLSRLALHGNDLIDLGMKPGKEMGHALSLALDGVIEGKVPNEREALIAYLKQAAFL